jgi:hypothetical protein
VPRGKRPEAKQKIHETGSLGSEDRGPRSPGARDTKGSPGTVARVPRSPGTGDKIPGSPGSGTRGRGVGEPKKKKFREARKEGTADRGPRSPGAGESEDRDGARGTQEPGIRTQGQR